MVDGGCMLLAGGPSMYVIALTDRSSPTSQRRGPYARPAAVLQL